MAHEFPHLLQLTGDQLTEQRTHMRARKEVPLFADLDRSLIVTVLNVIERELHVSGHGYRTAGADLVKDDFF